MTSGQDKQVLQNPTKLVKVTDHQVTCPDNHTIRCCYLSINSNSGSPPSGQAILHFHGGGMTQGSVNDSITSLMRIVAKTGVPIFSVDYTLAPEAQAPAQVIEGYAALSYLVEREEFGVNRDRVGVMGESAGGTLAACLVHWTMKYPKGPKFRKQILIYPMLDDRNITPDPDPDFRPQLWSHRDNARSWLAFLGDQASNDDIPPTSSPGRMTFEQARGLPSTYLDIGDKDIFRDECIEYCAKLAKAGVEIELHVLPGMGHAFDWLYTAKPAVQAVVRARYRAISGI